MTINVTDVIYCFFLIITQNVHMTTNAKLWSDHNKLNIYIIICGSNYIEMCACMHDFSTCFLCMHACESSNFTVDLVVI